MPTYTYKAKSFEGEIKSGRLEAKDEKDLANILRQEGYLLTCSEPLKRKNIFGFDIFSKIGGASLAEKMIFCRHLAVLIKAGLFLTRALEILAKQSRNKTFKKIILEIKEDVVQGKPFSKSLEKHPNVFSEIFCSMIKVGEEGGSLEGVLKLLAHQLEKEYELNSKIKGAMIYPITILLVMIGVGILLMVMVIPRFISVFEEREITLPLTTSLLIATAKFFHNFWYLIPIIILGIVIGGKLFLQTKFGKKLFAKFLLSFPIIGTLTKQINIARTSRTLSSLLESGVPIIRALEVTSRTLENYYYREALINVAKNIQKGEGLSESLQKYEKIYSVLFIQMIAVGGETGTLTEILKQLAGFLEEEVSNATRNLSTIIEPILLIFMGVAVAFFALSILQPIYSSVTEFTK